MIFAGVNGYLDKLSVADVGRFEQGLLGYMRSEGKDVLETIRKEKAISDDTKAKLTAAIDAYAKTFA